MITRRCTQRQFLLRPDERTNAIFEYCLAEAAQRFDIGLLAWVAMSNHYHAIVFDAKGRLPAFIEHLHKMLAKVLNGRWNRTENLWSSEETCITYLPTPEDVFRKTVYVLSNPFASHAVDRLSDWPGSSSFGYLNGKRTMHRRPTVFFRKTGVMPEQVALHLDIPEAVLGVRSLWQWAERVREAVLVNEFATRKKRLVTRTPIWGRKAVMRATPSESPATPTPRRRLRPTLAAHDKATRIAELCKLKAFHVAYDIARRRFAAGDMEVEFPPGTYRMRLLGARCTPVVSIAA